MPDFNVRISNLCCGHSLHFREADMLITFTCPECKAELEAQAAAAGSQVLCPQCSKTLTVPRKGPGPGVTIGQFQIQKLLGKGGMGEVYLARQLSLGRDIALKILPARLRDQKARVQRFFKEVQTLARLDHPNIVMAHEAGEDEDILYLAMSYVPGDSLEKSLQRNGPMAELEALKLIDKLAGALDYAWREHHLLHRDIKPANILLTSGGEIKLTDFGLAKCLDDATELTMSGDLIGSPNYMSPEQINSCADLDCRSDMYSLGTTLYHMLTGKLPFAGSTLVETLKKQIKESLPDPRIERPEISEDCIILLEIMLAKDRNDRHADYQTLRADIARVMAGERPTKGELHPGESVLLRLFAERAPRRPQTPPVGSKPPLKKKPAAGPKWAAGAVAGLAVVIGLALLFARGSCRKEQPAPSENTAPAGAAATSAPAAPAAESLPPAADELKTMFGVKYLKALKYTREHPEDFTGAQVLLESLAKESQGTEWEGKVADEIERMERSRKHAVYKAVTLLKADIQAQVAQSNFDGALKRIELDAGIVTEETKAARAELMLKVKAMKLAAEEAQAREAAESEKAKQAAAAREQLNALTQGLAGDLLKGNSASLAQRVAEARADTTLGPVSNKANELTALAVQAAGWPEQVARFFDESRGKLVTVELKNGRKESFTVTGIAGEKIQGQRQLSAGYVGREFSISELSAREKLKRIEDVPGPAGNLMRGLVLARCANDWVSAEKEFAAGGPLGAALVQMAPARQMPDKPSGAKGEEAFSTESQKPAATKTMPRKPMGPKEGPARQALYNLLKLADVSGDFSNAQAVAETIRRKDYSPSTVADIKKALALFNKNYVLTETAQEYAPVLSALGNVENYSRPPPGQFKPWWRREWRTGY